MRTILAVVFISMIGISAFSQETFPVKQRALGIHFFFNDFKTVSAIRSSSLSSTLANKTFGKMKDMVPGLGISYWQGINSHLDFSTNLNGSFLDYTTREGKVLGNQSFLMEADASLHGKMLTDHYWVVPYLSAGLGLSKYKGYFGAIMPVGVGLQVNIFDETFIMIDSQYRLGVSQNSDHHFFHSIGIVGNIGRSKD